MSSNQSDSVGKQNPKVLLRDWFLFPIISVSTVLLVAVSVEMSARWLYPVAQVDFDRCFVRNDLSGEAPARPHGMCSERMVESKYSAEYRFNGHGDRAGMELEAKPRGVYRIVMIGSSMAMGLYVPRELSFAALLPSALSGRTGHRVELYNAATGGKFRGGSFPNGTSMGKFADLLSARPNIILWVVTPKDIENAGLDSEIDLPQEGISHERTLDSVSKDSKKLPEGVWNAIFSKSLGEKLAERIKTTRTFIVLNHLLISHESQDQYVSSALKNDDDGGFLRVNWGEKWERNLVAFKRYATQFFNQGKLAGVPLVVVLIPNRVEATMISRNAWPHGYDPYRLGEVLRGMVEGQGGVYVDLLPCFRRIPNPEQHYFAVDGHLDDDGHAMIARMLEDELSKLQISELRIVAEPHPTIARR
jgi:hypothetical protein